MHGATMKLIHCPLHTSFPLQTPTGKCHAGRLSL